MRHRRLIAGLLIVASLPTLALAQRGGGGSRRDRGTDANWDEITRREPTTILSVREVEAMDPLRHLMAKRKDLKLTDAQVAQLKALDDSGKVRDEPLLKQLDSLRREMRPSGPVDDVQRLRLQVVRRNFAETVERIRANYDAAAAAALPTLEEAQRAQATELLAKQKAEADKVVAEKLGSGRRQPPRDASARMASNSLVSSVPSAVQFCGF